MLNIAKSLSLFALISLVAGCAPGGDKKEEAQESGAPEQRAERAPEAMQVVVPAGTTFAIALDQALSSKTSHPGDPVRAHVVGEVRSDGELVIADGAAAHGVVAEVEESGRVSGRAFLAMNITSIETVAGRHEVQTAMVGGKMEAEGTKKRDAATIVGGTAAGAVLGEIIGDEAKLGAIIGGAAGTGVVLATKGKELNLDPGARIDLKLTSPITVKVARHPGA